MEEDNNLVEKLRGNMLPDNYEVEGQLTIFDYLKEKEEPKDTWKWLYHEGNSTHGTFPSNRGWEKAEVVLRDRVTKEERTVIADVTDMTFRFDDSKGESEEVVKWRYMAET